MSIFLRNWLQYSRERALHGVLQGPYSSQLQSLVSSSAAQNASCEEILTIPRSIMVKMWASSICDVLLDCDIIKCQHLILVTLWSILKRYHFQWTECIRHNFAIEHDLLEINHSFSKCAGGTRILWCAVETNTDEGCRRLRTSTGAYARISSRRCFQPCSQLRRESCCVWYLSPAFFRQEITILVC